MSFISHRSVVRSGIQGLCILSFVVLGMVLSVVFSSTTVSACTVLGSGSQVPANYGAPYSFYGSKPLLIKSGDCTESTAGVIVGDRNSDTYVYGESYYWSGSRWVKVNLSGSPKQGAWIAREGTGSIPLVADRTWYVAYTCQNVSGQWRCGCGNAECTQKLWQVQGFVKPSVIAVSTGQGGGTPGARDSFWNGKGYRLFWSTTPVTSDMGMPIRTWIQEKWTNGHGITQWYQPVANAITLARAPDGTPSVRGFIPKGVSAQQFYARGEQLGKTGHSGPVVFSTDWYNPCQGGNTANGKSGSYIGIGHHWGAVPGVSHAPGGSTNFDDAWSLRGVLLPSGGYALYAYIPDKTKASGLTVGTSVKPRCDVWQTIELEVIPNTLGSDNGIMRMYVGGTRIAERTNLTIRTKAVNTRGMGIMTKHNSGAPEDEYYYWKNWRIYVK